MSPEERARMLRNFVCTHYRSGIGAVIGPTSGEFFCEKCVAHEIRAAENDALERAAGRLMSLIEACEGCEGDPNHPCPMCVAQDEAIDVIRSLKSKPPEGE